MAGTIVYHRVFVRPGFVSVSSFGYKHSAILAYRRRNMLHWIMSLRRITAFITFAVISFSLFIFTVRAAAIQIPDKEQWLQQAKDAHQACLEAKSGAHRSALQKQINVPRGGTPNQESYDVKYYDLDLTFDRPTQNFYGNVAMAATVTNPILTCEIDCVFMLHVDSVKVNNVSAPFGTTGLILTVSFPKVLQPGETFTVRTFYHSTEPELAWWGLHFVDFQGYPIVGNLSEPFYSRTWWPCKDFPHDKADSIDITITYPSNQFCSSNGKLISDVDNLNGFRTTHWAERYPISTYLVSVAISEVEHWRDYALKTDTDSLPVDYWVYPPLLAFAQQTYLYTPMAIDTLSKLFGKYPFSNEKYAMSNFMWGGAMEHQTNTSMSPSVIGNVMILVHELAHQWWGDMITCRDWRNIWLNEGFATYSEALFYESVFGKEGLHDYMNGIQYFGPGSIYYRDTTNSGSILDIIVYDKGGWVLHMLRGVIGDSAFFNGLRSYGDSPLKYGNATTDDFKHYMEIASGKDLDWFFNEWIYGHSSPVYEYSWLCSKTMSGNYKLDFIVEQVQTDAGLFKMPIEIKYVTTSDTLTDTLWNEQGFTLYQLEFADSVADVIFDPDNWILKGAVEKPMQLTIISRYPPNGEENVPYNFQMEAIAGVEPYTWSFMGGDLPYGLEFTGGNQGSISGIPTYAATYYFTIGVTDSSDPPVQQNFSFGITIDKAVLIGDCSGDGMVNITDAVFLINYIFAGGVAPNPLRVGDVNCDGIITISDVVRIIYYLFRDGPAPCS